MHLFRVTIKTKTQAVSYIAIASHSFDAHEQAVKRFGLCKISVRPA